MSRIEPSIAGYDRSCLVQQPIWISELRTEGEYSLQIFDEVGDQGVVGNDIHLRNQTRITL